ncbi:MAG: exodeoxyribonuclease VII small subunit [Myxococcales bacterium]|nr:exodeoxyribonuclease VII small subunit [Myxococcales bacterium]
MPQPKAGHARAEKDKELPFEALLTKLESVVGELEEGEAPLEEALQAFERGVALARLANLRLDEAERRIEVLLDDGSGQTRALETDDDEGADDE